MLGSTIRFVSAPPGNKASRMVIEFDCDAAAAVGDLVFQDSLVAEKVNVCEDNTTLEPCIGVLILKLQATRCQVLILGLQDSYSGLSIGDRVYLGTDGSITTTKPATGYMQSLGQVVAPDTVFFIPNSQRVLQI